jgi:hypothetical protein
MRREESLVIDKSYAPKIGDVLWNERHPLIVIQDIYDLDRTSLRKNKSYTLQVLKYQALLKIIKRKEAIWDQHKHDLNFFPDLASGSMIIDRNNPNYYNPNYSYALYLYYNDFNQYRRLYNSKYSKMPSKKVRVKIGKKPMVTISHSLCKHFVVYGNSKYTGYACNYWGGRHSQSVISLVNQGFKYIGNIYQDLLQEVPLNE